MFFPFYIFFPLRSNYDCILLMYIIVRKPKSEALHLPLFILGQWEVSPVMEVSGLFPFHTDLS